MFGIQHSRVLRGVRPSGMCCGAATSVLLFIFDIIVSYVDLQCLSPTGCPIVNSLFLSSISVEVIPGKVPHILTSRSTFLHLLLLCLSMCHYFVSCYLIIALTNSNQ